MPWAGRISGVKSSVKISPSLIYSHKLHAEKTETQETMPIVLQAILVIQLLQLILNSGLAAESEDAYTVTCSPRDVNLIMSGTPAGVRLVQGWQKEYTNKYCPGFNLTFETNSWDTAAFRVCDSSLVHVAADLAGMGGSFFPSQATTDDGWSYKCKHSKLQCETTMVCINVNAGRSRPPCDVCVASTQLS